MLSATGWVSSEHYTDEKYRNENCHENAKAFQEGLITFFQQSICTCAGHVLCHNFIQTENVALNYLFWAPRCIVNTMIIEQRYNVHMYYGLVFKFLLLYDNLYTQKNDEMAKCGKQDGIEIKIFYRVLVKRGHSPFAPFCQSLSAWNQSCWLAL